MRTPNFSVFLVDDDPGVLKALTRLLQTAGYMTKAFSSSKAFLDEYDPSVPGCAVLEALADGRIHPERYRSYIRMRFGDD